MPPGVRLSLTRKEIKQRKAKIDKALAAGVDINGLYEGEHYTFLTCSSSLGFMPIVIHLIDKGADPNVMDPLGFRPLHAARARGNEDVAELLLARGADPSLASRTTGLAMADMGECIIA